MSREQSQEFEVCNKCWTLQQHALRSPCYVNDYVTLLLHKFDYIFSALKNLSLPQSSRVDWTHQMKP
ncbi:hypothetical protein D5086_025732 [Populus alba]|uniref:Uncharacterized protein n=1 Tax=Populus alba TaxID=43335 RepID=A0ACC4AZZ5_POPAL